MYMALFFIYGISKLQNNMLKTEAVGLRFRSTYSINRGLVRIACAPWTERLLKEHIHLRTCYAQQYYGYGQNISKQKLQSTDFVSTIVTFLFDILLHSYLFPKIVTVVYKCLSSSSLLSSSSFSIRLLCQFVIVKSTCLKKTFHCRNRCMYCLFVLRRLLVSTFSQFFFNGYTVNECPVENMLRRALTLTRPLTYSQCGVHELTRSQTRVLYALSVRSSRPRHSTSSCLQRRPGMCQGVV